ncbi:MAG: histidine phosphatase family protein [Lachnospiraceae bacterium]|nr:histidine phosphatase family protein [Lachnospiraceae bacterium]
MRNRSENQIELYLIRHGATKANREHRYLGRTEEPLSEEGREALKAFQKKGIYPDPASLQALFVSPMERCRETAELLFGDCEQHMIPEFREMDFGLFEGKNYQDLRGNAQYQAWIDSNGTLPFPKGESREDFIARCRRGFEEMLRIVTAEGISRNEERKNIAAVVHGGTIMAVCSSFTDGEYFDFQIGNGEGYRCKVTVGQPSGEIQINELCKLIKYEEC